MKGGRRHPLKIGTRVPGCENSKCKGPEAAISLTSLGAEGGLMRMKQEELGGGQWETRLARLRSRRLWQTSMERLG